MVRRARPVYGHTVISALRAFLAEPAVPDPPGPMRRDRLLVAVLVIAGLVEVLLRDDLARVALGVADLQVAWPGVALVAGVIPAVLLPWRRSRPLPVTAAVCGSVAIGDAVTLLGTGDQMGLYTLAYVLLLPYALFRWGRGVEAAAGLAIVLFMSAVAPIATGAFGDLALGLPFVMLPAALGASLRYRASSRQGEADQIRLREREQLARELHDTVAHHVSAIAIRAQAGRTLAPTQPDAAVLALEVIEQAASRALADMRALVGALRDGDEATTAPQRGVSDIRLLGRAAGVPSVDVQLTGALDDLPPLIDAAAYRIAQESVTNALRHARNARRIDVRVAGDGDRVCLNVEDDGEPVPFSAEHAPGYGLIGMSERATVLGGTLEAGPGASGGWTVTAVLPRRGGDDRS
jgi:signal transduction histidine kinase